MNEFYIRLGKTGGSIIIQNSYEGKVWFRNYVTGKFCSSSFPWKPAEYVKLLQIQRLP